MHDLLTVLMPIFLCRKQRTQLAAAAMSAPTVLRGSFLDQGGAAHCTDAYLTCRQEFTQVTAATLPDRSCFQIRA